MGKRILFIIKERKLYGTKTKCYGLYNSCNFIARALRHHGYHTKVVQVVDNNCIDREVHNYKPTHCFIEALWVVPSKFEVLSKLHPNVHWVVRLHSMIPFLASEGIAFDWIKQYMQLKSKGINITVSVNNEELYEDLLKLYPSITYSPNIYCPDKTIKHTEHIHVKTDNDILNIGCFGALRVLKNHLQQAVWAMQFANTLNKKLHFHVNISEHEQKEAGPVLKNLRAIFEGTQHTLIEHPWYEHVDFLHLVRKMDVGMQISFTETFNIVAADFVDSNIPIIVSNEIDFVCPLFKVNSTNSAQVINRLTWAYKFKKFNLQAINKIWLNRHNDKALLQWFQLLNN